MTGRRNTLSPRLAYALAAGVIGLSLFASVTPSPLYRSYSVLWHFSSLTLTLVYATYAFGVLVTLLLAGSVSDDVGRRPVLLVSLATLGVSTLLYMAASSPAWLFAARGIQGLATGAALSAASAALLDLHPRRDAAAVGLANGTVSAGGLGLGGLASAALVELGWAPRVLPYALLLVLFAIAFAGAYAMPEPVRERRPLRLRLERPGVPAAVRRPFALAALAVLASWSIGGLFFSLGPELASELFHSTNEVVSASGIALLAGAAVGGQLLTARAPTWLAAVSGSLALAAGVGIIVAAAALGSGTAYLVGSLVGGAGFGAAFLGGLRALGAAIPPPQRAAVMAAFYLVAYASLSVPAVLAGVVVTHVPLETTFEIFGTAVAAVALAVAAEAWRSRPRRLLVAGELARAEA